MQSGRGLRPDADISGAGLNKHPDKDQSDKHGALRLRDWGGTYGDDPYLAVGRESVWVGDGE